MAETTEHICPETSYGMLPFIIHDAAIKGNSQEVLDWLDNGGDINATDLLNQTLLYTSCKLNHVHLLRELLKRPNVHLNHYVKVFDEPIKESNDDDDDDDDDDKDGRKAKMRSTNFKFFSPLDIALLNGNGQCIETLLSSNVECLNNLADIIELEKLKILDNRSYWKCINIIKSRRKFIANEISEILQKAIMQCKINIIREMVPHFSTSTSSSLILNLFTAIYLKGMWEATKANDLIKKFLIIPNNIELLTVLTPMVGRKDWKILEPLFHILIDNVGMNICLIEAVLEMKTEEVRQLLSSPLDKSIINGTVLVASIGGTSEEIVKLLFDHIDKDQEKLINIILILSRLNGRQEFLSLLMATKSFSYQTLNLANSIKDRTGAGELPIKRAINKMEEKIMDLCDKSSGNLPMLLYS